MRKATAKIKMLHRVIIVSNNVYKGEKGIVRSIDQQEGQCLYDVYLDLGGHVKLFREDIELIEDSIENNTETEI
jgi:hypothetical protein